MLPTQTLSTNQDRAVAARSGSGAGVSERTRTRGGEGEETGNVPLQQSVENLASTTAAAAAREGVEPVLVATGNPSNQPPAHGSTATPETPPTAVNHTPNQVASNTSSRVNINALSGSSALSQVTPDAVLSGSNANISPANLRSSANSTSELSVANSTSSRAAARLRAETRRESLLTSSEDDDIMNGQSHHSHHRPRGRPKRRRSQGSGSYIGGHRSQESVNRIDGDVIAEVPLGEVRGQHEEGERAGHHMEDDQGEEEENPEPPTPADGSSRGSLNSRPPSSAAPSRSQPQERSIGKYVTDSQAYSVAIIPCECAKSHKYFVSDVAIENAMSAFPAPLQSCGHSCEGRVGQGEESDLCCVCSSKSRGEEGGVSPTDPVPGARRECQLCAAR